MNYQLNWSALPERFRYLCETTEAHSRWLWGNTYRDAMTKMTPAHIDRLAKLYQEIDSRNDASHLSIWLRDRSDDEKRSSTGIYRPIMNVFGIFDHLRRQGVAPFNSGRVRY